MSANLYEYVYNHLLPSLNEHSCTHISTGFTSVVLSTVEKHYRFSSLAASMIIAVFGSALL